MQLMFSYNIQNIIRHLKALSCCLFVYAGIAFAQTATDQFEQLKEQVEEARLAGNMQRADSLAEDLYLLANISADSLKIAAAAFQQARNFMERNLYDDAIPLLQKAIDAYQAADEELLAAHAIKRLGQTYRYQARYSEALALAYTALRIFEQYDNKDDVASAHNNIANILEHRGEYLGAMQAHNRALDLHRQSQNKEGISSALYNLGAIWQQLGSNDIALEHFQKALEMDLEIGDPKYIAYSHNKIGYLYNELENYALAGFHVHQAVKLFTQIQAPRDTDWAYSSLAKHELGIGNIKAAQGIIDGVIERAIENKYQSLLVDAYRIAAEIALAQNNAKEALRLIMLGVNQAKHNNESIELAQLQALNVAAHILNGTIDKAFMALQKQKAFDDNLFSEALTVAASNAKLSEEIFRKEQEVALLKTEKAMQKVRTQQQHYSRNVLIICMVGLFGLLALLYRSLAQRNVSKYLAGVIQERTEELEQKNTELQLAYKDMESISLTDKLTGLKNRRFLENQIQADLEQSLRQYIDFKNGKTIKPSNNDIVIFMIDIDNFKAVNDKYGHNAGDLVLKQLASRMQKVFRQSDYLVRWGGEEFIGIARFIDKKDSPMLAQRMLEAINKDKFSMSESKSQYQTCSIGYVSYPVALLNQNNQYWHSFISLADACLYAAKYSGKNSWVGMHDILDPNLELHNLTPERVGQWHEQNKIQILSSFTDVNSIKWSSD
jgi:two-component system cell cycle response regulator